MPQPFSRSNPLSLAVLTVLWNEPMHPYRIMQTLERQQKHDEVGFTIGSLYNVVDSLTKCGLIVAVGAEQAGQRPPRTVYAVTDSGIAEATAWVRELLAHPVAEYPKFMVGLSLLPFLPPDEAADLLRTRTRRLESIIDAAETSVRESPVPEILLIEKQYAAALAHAEIDFIRSLIDRIDSGSLAGTTAFRALHARLAARVDKRLSPTEITLLTVELGLNGDALDGS
ncbi:PadR family transcriptional regulator [Nocardia sp. NPDC052001]|uniref:PadR family transcriptional regulator n=1 Tax=Nocardia sp. NPDC052001 TaxID=3154853 RepID=UPI0034303BEB